MLIAPRRVKRQRGGLIEEGQAVELGNKCLDAGADLVLMKGVTRSEGQAIMD